MTVVTMYDFEGEPTPTKCLWCNTELEKWINIVPFGDLCPSCAQHFMRLLFQDLIEYHNGKSVSLLNIFYHGKKEGEYWNPGPKGKLYDNEKIESPDK